MITKKLREQEAVEFRITYLLWIAFFIISAILIFFIEDKLISGALLSLLIFIMISVYFAIKLVKDDILKGGNNGR